MFLRTHNDGRPGCVSFTGSQPRESAWLSPASQHEEAWFLGLRLNAGVEVAALEQEFGHSMVAPAVEVRPRLQEAGLLTIEGESVRLTAQGQLLSNDVFQEFLGLAPRSGIRPCSECNVQRSENHKIRCFHVAKLISDSIASSENYTM